MHQSFTKYIQQYIYMCNNLLVLELPYKRASFFSFIYESRKSCVQSYLYEKNKDPHSFSLSLTNIYGMLETTKKQFQCYEVQRLGTKKLVVAHCATRNDNHLLERGRPIFLQLFFLFFQLQTSSTWVPGAFTNCFQTIPSGCSLAILKLQCLEPSSVSVALF